MSKDRKSSQQVFPDKLAELNNFLVFFAPLVLMLSVNGIGAKLGRYWCFEILDQFL